MVDVEMLPVRRQVEAASKLGQVYTDPITGKVYDFSGTGDADYARHMGEQYADYRKEYDPVFNQLNRDSLEAMDPEAFQLRENMGNDLLSDVYDYSDKSSTARIREELERQMTEELMAGGKLNDAERREVEQALMARQGMNGPGATLGNSAAYQSAMESGQAAQQKKMSRMGMALQFLGSGESTSDQERGDLIQELSTQQSFVFGQPLVAQTGYLSQGQQGAAPFQTLSSSQNANAGQMGSQFAMQSYQQQSENWANTGNPWMEGIGMALQAGGTAASFMSDLRVKTDIVEIDRDWRGFRIVQFRYRTDPVETVRKGVIAQEVLKHVPEAVHYDTASGYYRVDYDLLGLAHLTTDIQQRATQ